MALVAPLVALSGCSGGGRSQTAPPDMASQPPTPLSTKDRLQMTLTALTGMGPKRAATSSGRAAAQYMADQFGKAGLTDVHDEAFSFPSYVLDSSSFALTIAGASQLPQYEVFYYSGAADVNAAIVDVGDGSARAYPATAVSGKIALVHLSQSIHRTVQYQQALAHNCAAVVFVGYAPGDLIQQGTVQAAGTEIGSVPALSVSANTGAMITNALAAGQSVQAHLAVAAHVVAGQATNVVARIEGSDPSGKYFLVGAHFDTWFAGAVDNGSGAAELLEVARQLALDPTPKLGIVFVAYDAEEVGLLGGYDFLRKHIVAQSERPIAFVNFEMPSDEMGQNLRAMAYTPGLDTFVGEIDAKAVYSTLVGLSSVPQFYGGLIPTDIQGMYWYGVQGLSTACQSQFYHAVEDTLDKVDLDLLSNSVDHMVSLMQTLESADVTMLESSRDPDLWSMTTSSAPTASGLDASIAVTDASGASRAGAKVDCTVFVDDFTEVFTSEQSTDGSGKVVCSIPAAALQSGSGSRWLHVRAGVDYPLAETVVPLR